MSKIILNGIEYSNGITYQELQPVIYSTEEREIGCFVDGKPLYQKSISIGAVTANTVKVIDITSLNVDYVADYIATAILTNGWKVPLPQTHTSSMTYQAFCRLSSSTQLAVGVGSSVGISDGYVTLQYTKTTDVAGSGNWNTDGVPTHHYSTNEQVIGTWIDGKPRYEITLSGSGSYSAGSELVVPLPTNADKVVIMGGYVDIGTDWLPLNLTLGVGTGTTNGVYCYPNKSTGIHIYSSAWTFSEYNVTVQYCKTTD